MKISSITGTRITRRSAAVAVVAALALGGVVSTGTSAQAASTPALTFTASITAPDTAAVSAGIPTSLAITFTNTSTVKFPIGRVSAQLPSGITGSAPTADRTGWTASVSGQTVSASLTRPATTPGVPPGGSIVLSVSVVSALVVSSPTSLPVPVKAAGPFGLIALKLSGAPPQLIALPAGTTAFKAAPGTPLTNIASPGSGDSTCDLNPDNPICSTADLTQGAYGNVYFGQRPCSTDEASCPLGTEVELNGDFGQLYTPEAPAKVNLICLAAKCPHAYPGSETPENEPANANYDYNLFNPYAGDEREVVEDYSWYPVYVQLKGALDFGELPAPPCVPDYDLVTKGKITSQLAIDTGYCVDVNAITRTGNAFSGDLIRPVLFIEDPRMR